MFDWGDLVLDYLGQRGIVLGEHAFFPDLYCCYWENYKEVLYESGKNLRLLTKHVKF